MLTTNQELLAPQVMHAVKNLSTILLSKLNKRCNATYLVHAQGLVVASSVRGVARDQELTLRALERGLTLTSGPHRVFR